MRNVSLQELETHAADLISEVEAGHRLTLIRGGKPVADIVPHVVEQTLDADREAARKRLLELLEEGIPMDGKPLTRDEIYDRG